MTPFIRIGLRKLGRAGLVIILTFLATALAGLLHFFFARLFGFTYILVENITLVVIVTVLVTPLVSWYLVGLFFKIDEMEIKMAQLATIDSLTNTSNRRHFYQRVEQFLSNLSDSVSLSEQADRLEYGDFPGFFILDLDNLKSINDQYGHAAGDKVLAAFGGVLLDLAPRASVVSRLGGDEFAVFLDKTVQSTPQDFAGKILERVRSTKIEFDGCPISFSTSIGFSSIRGIDGHAIDMAMKAADDALYKVKRSGRNGFAMSDVEY